MSTLKFFSVFLTHPATLYFDDVRLEGDGLPQFDGLRAFAFGPSTAGVFAGGVSGWPAGSDFRRDAGIHKDLRDVLIVR